MKTRQEVFGDAPSPLEQRIMLGTGCDLVEVRKLKLVEFNELLRECIRESKPLPGLNNDQG